MNGIHTPPASARASAPSRPVVRWALAALTVRWALAALAGVMLLSGCGDTLQDQPIGPAPFESVIVKSHFPVYWLGLRFGRLRATGVTSDPGGAITIQYGDCTVGGQYTCVTPLSIVTSPDNSFVPGGPARSSAWRIRGVLASAQDAGKTIAVPTGPVVVSLYADSAALARAAAQAMVALGEAVVPGAPLPARRPDTGFDRAALPSQLPSGA